MTTARKERLERARIDRLRASQRGCDAAADVFAAWLTARGHSAQRSRRFGGAIEIGGPGAWHAVVSPAGGRDGGPWVLAPHGGFVPNAWPLERALSEAERRALEADAMASFVAARDGLTPPLEATAVLRNAAKLVRSGWCKGAQARDAGGGEAHALADEATSWCAVGAVVREAWGDEQLVEQALRLFVAAIGVDGLEDDWAAAWNDARTQDIAAEALECAAIGRTFADPPPPPPPAPRPPAPPPPPPREAVARLDARFRGALDAWLARCWLTSFAHGSELLAKSPRQIFPADCDDAIAELERLGWIARATDMPTPTTEQRWARSDIDINKLLRIGDKQHMQPTWWGWEPVRSNADFAALALERLGLSDDGSAKQEAAQ